MPDITLAEWGRRVKLSRARAYQLIGDKRLEARIVNGHYVVDAKTPKPARLPSGRRVKEAGQ